MTDPTVTDAHDYMDPVPVRDVTRCIAGLAAPGRTVLIGIDGGSGAGKTTFTRWFADQLRKDLSAPVRVVLTDLIYRPVADRWTGPVDEMPIGYDLDWERIRDEVLLPLGSGNTARVRLYDWVADRLGEPVEIEAGGVVIIDGVCALRRELVDHYDLRIWFSCPLDVRVARLLNRGDTQEELDYWLPIEKRYHRAHAPDRSADLVLDSAADMFTGGGENRLRVLKWSNPHATQ